MITYHSVIWSLYVFLVLWAYLLRTINAPRLLLPESNKLQQLCSSDKRLYFYNFRCCIIYLNCDNVEVRIVPPTCSNCFLSCFSNVTQNVILLMTIRADEFAVDVKLDFLHCYQLPKKASWASRTKSMTSSSALTLKRSQNQSTAISDDAIVSNIKSWRSCRVWGEERSVFVFIPVWWHTLRDLVVHTDTKLRKRILRLLVPIFQLVRQPPSLWH